MIQGRKQCWAVLAAALSCIPAHAQENPHGPQGNLLQLDLSANVLYDTNVSRSSNAIAVARHLKPEDVSYSPQANLKASKSFGLDSVYLIGTIGYNFYQQNTALNRQSISSEAGVDLIIANCQSTVSGKFGQQQSDLGYVAKNTLNNLVTSTTVAVSTNCQRSVGFSPFISASRDWTTDSVEVMRVQNENQYSVSGGLAYNHPAIGQVSLFGQYQTARYPKRQFLYNGASITDGYEVEAGGIRYAHTFGTTLDLVLSLSYTSVNPTLTTQPGFGGAAYDTKLVWHPNWRLRIETDLSRDTRAAPQINASYARDTAATLRLTYRFSEKLDLDVAFQNATDNLSGMALVHGVNLSHQTTKGVNGSIKYDLSHSLSVAITAATENRQTDVVDFNYSSTRVGLSLTAHL